MTDLQASQKMQSVRDLLRSKGVSIQRGDEISDISTEIETGYENRANMDIVFHVITSFNEDIGCIEKVEVNPIFNGDDDSYPPFTVTI